MIPLNQEVTSLRRLRDQEGWDDHLSIGRLHQIPKEVLELIFEPMPPSTKLRALRVSKGWKNLLESEKSIWREVEFGMGSSWRKRLGIEACELFALNSGDTLRSIEVDFSTPESSEVERLFDVLDRSKNTLKELYITGWQMVGACESTFSEQVFELAAECTSLQEFTYHCIEDVWIEDQEKDDPRGNEWTDEDYEANAAYEEELLQNRKEDKQETINFKDLNFQSSPSSIDLALSSLTAINLAGDYRFFKEAETIKIDFHRSDEAGKGRFTEDDIEGILRASRRTLRTFELKDWKYEQYQGKDKETLEPIELPRLTSLKLLVAKERSSRGVSPISIIAPCLEPQLTTSVKSLDNFIIYPRSSEESDQVGIASAVCMFIGGFRFSSFLFCSFFSQNSDSDESSGGSDS